MTLLSTNAAQDMGGLIGALELETAAQAAQLSPSQAAAFLCRHIDDGALESVIAGPGTTAFRCGHIEDGVLENVGKRQMGPSTQRHIPQYPYCA
jgi:hypothetical protein